MNLIFPEYLCYLFLFSGKPTTKLRNLVDWRSSLIQNSTILKHRSLGKTPPRIKWIWTNCLIFCQKRSLTPQHQVQDQSGQCCQLCFFQYRQLNAENLQNKSPVLRMSTKVCSVNKYTKRISVLWLSYRFFEELLFHIANLSGQKL